MAENTRKDDEKDEEMTNEFFPESSKKQGTTVKNFRL